MRFDVWAPRAEGSCELVVDGRRVVMNPDTTHGETRGWWTAETEDGIGSRYGFSIDNGPVVYDPRGLKLPDGPGGLSEVWDQGAFTWSDEGWGGVPRDGAVIYELHIGTFTHAGTFDAAIERLDHLVALGVTLVEILPVASFPGRAGWGYDGVAPYAVHEPYGGPEGLQRFVDACHARGLGVCVDVVYNHLGPDGNVTLMYGPYFNDDYETPWGLALNLDGPESDPVREWVLGHMELLMRDFHVDALRLDAVHELHDERAVPILEEMSRHVAALSADLGRELLLIAESDRNDPATVTARDLGGLGMDAQWADDIHHALHVALTGETQGYYHDFAAPDALSRVLTGVFFHADTWSTFRGRRHGRPVNPDRVSGAAFVASLQTHDQVGNRAIGDRLSATLGQRRLCCGAALLLTSPYTPMLFMGEEWAASTPWQYFTDHTDHDLAEAVRRGRRWEFSAHGWDADLIPDPQSPETVAKSTLLWDEVGTGEHAAVLQWYTDLLRLRREREDLRAADLRTVDVDTPAEGVVVVTRGSYRVAVNLSESEFDVDLGVGDEASVLLSLDELDVTDGRLLLPPDGAAIVGPA